MSLKTNTSEKIFSTLRILISVFFILSGVLELMKHQATYPKYLEMGYPPFFIAALGVCKIIGGILLIQTYKRYLQEWAIMGFIFDVVFAFISEWHIHSTIGCIKAIIALSLLIMIYTRFLKTNKVNA